jgi:hypothetical protein
MYDWANTSTIERRTYTCGYCGDKVGVKTGYRTDARAGSAAIYICPTCERPTFFDGKNDQTPRERLGNKVGGITDEGIKAIYEEARKASSAKAYTATVLVCRKILMNMAVSRGSAAGQTFISYVDYLANQGYVPPDGRAWLDAIRQKGNDATHEIALMDENDAKRIVHFTEMLLRFNFEMKAMLNP